jgi:hypothetical protein
MNDNRLLKFKVYHTSNEGSLLNGSVIPVFDRKNIICVDNHFSFNPQNIFINNILPFHEKGFYLHKSKETIIICISGEIEIIIQKDFEEKYLLKNSHEFNHGIVIKPGLKFKLNNSSQETVILLHICNEEWM